MDMDIFHYAVTRKTLRLGSFISSAGGADLVI